MADNWFFLSYARADDREDLVGRFYRDLTAQVQQEAGVSQQQVSFIDHDDIHRGAEWEPHLAEALRTSRILVPLYSPNYFNSEFCGREWQVFSEHGQAIKPVWWRNTTAIPEPVKAIQHRYKSDPAAYRENGLYTILWLDQHKDAYREFVLDFAKELVKAAQQLGAAARPAIRPIHEVQNVFAAKATAVPSFAGAVRHSSPPGPKYVKFAVLTGLQGQMKNLRQAWEQVYGTDPRRWDWKPFLPDFTDEIGMVVTDFAATSRRLYEFLPYDAPPELLARIDEAEKNNNIVLIVVDPWSTKLDLCLDFLTEYDKGLPGNCALMVLWNEKDEQNRSEQAMRQAVKHHLRKHLQFNVKFWDAIPSAEDLKAAFAQAVEVVRCRIELVSPNFRAADDGNPYPRPNIDPNHPAGSPR